MFSGFLEFKNDFKASENSNNVKKLWKRYDVDLQLFKTDQA